MIVHDVFGWKSPNPRLLADHYAKEADATVYVPDLYVPQQAFLDQYQNKTMAYVEIFLVSMVKLLVDRITRVAR